MDITQFKQLIWQELPAILEKDIETQEFILNLVQKRFAEKKETESRFDRILDELRRDREEDRRKWDEHDRKFEKYQQEQNEKWREHDRKFEKYQQEQNEKWREHDRKFEKYQQEQNEKWREQNRNLKEYQQEQNEKWKENQKVINDTLEKIKQQDKRHDRSIGALGARWGMQSEKSFRNGLKAILEESFDVEVLNVTEFDTIGEVHGTPDQVEIDVIIKNGVLILCEMKSSMSRNDMHAFNRKILFYENRHQCKATRKMVISPMIEENAKKVAERFGIELYDDSEDVTDLYSF